MKIATRSNAYRACTISRIPDRRLVRNLWRGLRDAKLNTMLGAEKFGDYINHTINVDGDNRDFFFDDGEKYNPPLGGKSYKTIDNFINESSSIFKNIFDGGADSLKTSMETLHYAQAFLWCLYPERVEKWKKEPRPINIDTIVSNLDDSFRIVKTSNLFSSVFSFYEYSLYGDVRSYDRAKKLHASGEIGEKTEKAVWAQLLGRVIVQERPNDIHDRVVLISPTQWEHFNNIRIGKSLPNGEVKFDGTRSLSVGHSLSYESKQMRHRDDSFLIADNQYTCANKFVNYLDGSEQFVAFQLFMNTLIKNDVFHDCIMDAMSDINKVTFFDDASLKNSINYSAICLLKDPDDRSEFLFNLISLVK